MSLTLSVALYFLIWWTVLFAILPLGVRSQIEEGEVVPGSEGAAPHRPMLLWKALITTLVSAVVLAIVYYVIAENLVSAEMLPFMPEWKQ